MASNSLKIVNPDGSINEWGYIAVVDNIVLDPDGLDEFVGEDDDAGFTKGRTRKLRRHANSAGGKLRQQDDENQTEDVTPRNCRIRAQLDTRKTGAKGFSKVTLSLPEENLMEADLSYVDDYIIKFLQIWTGDSRLGMPPPAANPARSNARKFMFGVMMLTKCR
jgi:hypothetical protein